MSIKGYQELSCSCGARWIAPPSGGPWRCDCGQTLTVTATASTAQPAQPPPQPMCGMCGQHQALTPGPICVLCAAGYGPSTPSMRSPPSNASATTKAPAVGDVLRDQQCKRCEAVGKIVIAELDHRTGAVRKALCRLCGHDAAKVKA